MTSRIPFALAALATASSVVSCAVAPRRGTAVDGRNVANGAIHWVHDARLREIMDELDRGLFKSWPQEVENEYAEVDLRKHKASLAEAHELAEALADAAGRIPQAVAHVKMAEVDRRSFVAQVETLRDQAGRLSEAASSRDPDAMRSVLGAISATCNSCHQRFRDIAGPMTPD